MNQYDDTDHILCRSVKDPYNDSGKSLKAHHPSDILPECHDAVHLNAFLEHYSHPFLQEVIPDGPDESTSQGNRRYYLYWIRPALRYYCQKYSVPVPKWLKTDTFYQSMGRTEKIRTFGLDVLEPQKEFRKINYTEQTEEGAPNAS